MADLQVPYINPIRLHRTDKVIDYSDNLPIEDLEYLRTQYQRGVYPVANLYPNFAVGETMYLEYFYSFGSELVAKVRDMATNTTYNATLTNVLPTGYTGNPILIASYEFNSEGVYRFEIELDDDTFNLVSDEFIVGDWSESKDFIKLRWSDSRNRLGGYYFDSNGTQIWNPSAYYTGIKITSNPTDEQSVYTSDSGSPKILKTAPQIVELVTLTDIHKNYVKVIKTQTACDNFYVNETRVTASDFNWTGTEKSVIGDVSFLITTEDNNYFIIESSD